MHGLINRSVQCFLRDTYGSDLWQRVVREAPLPVDTFEPMLRYDRALTDLMVDCAARILRRPREALLEDLGHYLVSHPNLESLRRLLRFGGVSFADFLDSLEELPGRARLAVSDLNMPDLTLQDLMPQDLMQQDLMPQDRGDQVLVLQCRFVVRGAGHVMLGLLRAMADDYGALVLMDHEGVAEDGTEAISIRLLDASHAEGRHFSLALPEG